MSLWTKCPAGRGWRTGEGGTEIESEENREGRYRKGRKTEPEAQRGERLAEPEGRNEGGEESRDLETDLEMDRRGERGGSNSVGLGPLES